MSHVQTIQERADQLKTEIENFIEALEYNQAQACMSRKVREAIFGKYYQAPRRNALEYEKRIARRVRDTMFCGERHIFCVYVTLEENGEQFYVPTRPDSHSFDFAVPVDKKIQIHVNALIDASTPPLHLYYHAYGRDEQENDVPGTTSNSFVLKYNESILVESDFYIANHVENDIFILKSENGVPILTMNFHSKQCSKQWIPKPKSRASEPYADERDLLNQIVDKLKKDVPSGDPEGISEDIDHLQGNFEHIVNTLRESQHTKKRRYDGMSGSYSFDDMVDLMSQLRGLYTDTQTSLNDGYF